MQYLLLIYENEALKETRNDADNKEIFSGYMKFTEEIKTGGQLVGGDALEPVATATTVRVRDGKALTTDGPFAETKEQLGGYYMVNAKDLDEALKIAARIPTAATGSIEVRPVMSFE